MIVMMFTMFTSSQSFDKRWRHHFKSQHVLGLLDALTNLRERHNYSRTETRALSFSSSLLSFLSLPNSEASIPEKIEKREEGRAKMRLTQLGLQTDKTTGFR